MTEIEASTILKAEIVHHPECSIFAEALGMAIQALEKQIPKKAEVEKYSFYPHSILIKSRYGKCPNCGTVQVDDRYCANFGQKLDWSEEQ